jgi:hypothetical protein
LGKVWRRLWTRMRRSPRAQRPVAAPILVSTPAGRPAFRLTCFSRSRYSAAASPSRAARLGGRRRITWGLDPRPTGGLSPLQDRALDLRRRQQALHSWDIVAHQLGVARRQAV